jgi:hypothetical protein
MQDENHPDRWTMRGAVHDLPTPRISDARAQMIRAR